MRYNPDIPIFLGKTALALNFLLGGGADCPKATDGAILTTKKETTVTTCPYIPGYRQNCKSNIETKLPKGTTLTVQADEDKSLEYGLLGGRRVRVYYVSTLSDGRTENQVGWALQKDVDVTTCPANKKK